MDISSLKRAPNEMPYALMSNVWPSGAYVKVYLGENASRYMAIPLNFLKHSGDNTWWLVLHMLAAIVDGEGVLSDLSTRQPVDPANKPSEGDYLFTSSSHLPLKWKRGPESARKGRPLIPGESDGASSVTGTSLSTTVVNPSNAIECADCLGKSRKFRERILMRDVKCLVTGADSESSQAAHLVPKAREDIYDNLLQNYFSSRYETSMGVLLRNDLHTRYDLFDWSLHYKEGTYYVHVFGARDMIDSNLHGKAIEPTRFSHQLPESDRPNSILCNWHYQQCCMAHLRGFSVDMAVNAF